MLWIVLILALNLVISWWNARVCGQAWAEANALGGFGKVLIWSGAIQSAIGFSMIYIFLMAGLGAVTGFLPAAIIKGMMSLWYLAIIVPALGTGLIITVHSWIAAYRERDFASIGTAAYNTIAQAHNMYGAIDGIGKALSGVGDLFDSDDPKAGIAIVLVIVALGGGILTTWALIRKYAGTLPLPQRQAATA